MWFECFYVIGCVKYVFLIENKFFFYDNSCDYKGWGGKFFINNRGLFIVKNY